MLEAMDNVLMGLSSIMNEKKSESFLASISSNFWVLQ
jgi:hypothetical protein